MTATALNSNVKRALIVLVFVGLCIPPFLLDTNAYSLRIATLILMFAGMATAWNIVGGEANLVSLGHTAFFGIGAYCSTLLLIHLQLSPWLGMIAALVLAGLASLIIGWPSFRLRGHYFALGTLAFAEIIRIIVLYYAKATGGALGISVPAMQDGWWFMQFVGNYEFYLIALGMFAVVIFIGHTVHYAPLGYRLRALRSSHEAAEVVGVNTLKTKLIANFISCSLMGAYGVLYAQMHFFIDPETVFSFWNVSIKVAMMSILGGLTYVWGPFVGAVVLTFLDEWTNAVFSDQFAGVGRVLYGVLLIILVLVRPRGLLHWGEQIFNRVFARLTK
ncbi:branched-chain amino acid ABC transporter permease [Orrella sp. NBD-18]|uniref:Branched-chain amino acid ABC transporter permease n=1 Tax=Sheuella amnicola TaxID=2707330 RepID=A0A6B2R179_9BURK|nr:branched-chain amino acid ABC transporter permease [Sheuella amnicola]NDY84071.1 branched-chain amino acid ABC transporter permease [Sheuella amnicola]HBI83003.1 branched-chain amino acid ABC transporter permease [Alcaligenaceae bacterium]